MAQGPTEWRPKDPFSAEAVLDELRAIAPSFFFETRWEVDEGHSGPEGQRLHDVTVTVSGIEMGRLYYGLSSMGSLYLKPEDVDLDINGNLPQMVEDALEDLPWEEFPNPVVAQLRKASQYIHSVIVRRRERSQRGKGL